MLFNSAGRGNVIACAVKYRDPIMTDPAKWPGALELAKPPFAGRLDLDAIRQERVGLPIAQLTAASVLSDDFAPVEFLDAIKSGNTGEK